MHASEEGAVTKRHDVQARRCGLDCVPRCSRECGCITGTERTHRCRAKQRQCAAVADHPIHVSSPIGASANRILTPPKHL